MSKQTDLNLKKARYCEAFCYSFELLSYNYNDLHEKCSKINADKQFLIPALSQAWAIVDIIHRIREILQSMPGLNTKDEQLKKILKATAVIEKFRHYIQHLRQELHRDYLYPIYGSLSWVDPQNELRCHIATSGFELEGRQHTGCVYDLHNSAWVSKVSLVVMDLSLNFDSVYKDLMDFKEYFYKWASDNYGGINLRNFNLDKIQTFSIDIELKQKVL
jgi:hypothetical protein